MNQSILDIEGLAVGYSSAVPVLANFDLQIKKGEIVCLIGASGVGKTSILNAIAGFIQPLQGTVKVASDSRLGYIFQHPPLLPWRTVQDNLLLGAELVGLEISQADILLQLKLFNLEPSILTQFPSQLSGGMRQRVAIIQSLLANPDLLLLDEPFSALDFPTRLKLEGEFWHMIKSSHKSALMVTHDLEEAIVLADRIILLTKSGCRSYPVNFAQLSERDPAVLRGMPEFAACFSQLWAEMRDVL